MRLNEVDVLLGLIGSVMDGLKPELQLPGQRVEGRYGLSSTVSLFNLTDCPKPSSDTVRQPWNLPGGLYRSRSKSTKRGISGSGGKHLRHTSRMFHPPVSPDFTC